VSIQEILANFLVIQTSSCIWLSSTNIQPIILGEIATFFSIVSVKIVDTQPAHGNFRSIFLYTQPRIERIVKGEFFFGSGRRPAAARRPDAGAGAAAPRKRAPPAGAGRHATQLSGPTALVADRTAAAAALSELRGCSRSGIGLCVGFGVGVGPHLGSQLPAASERPGAGHLADLGRSVRR